MFISIQLAIMNRAMQSFCEGMAFYVPLQSLEMISSARYKSLFLGQQFPVETEGSLDGQ